VDRNFLRREWRNAMDGVYTPDCRTEGCQQCGLCDFKTVRPVLCPEERQEPAGTTGFRSTSPLKPDGPGFRYRVYYRRRDDSRWYSHLEIMQLIFRSVRRAGLPIHHSRGFNPTPRISFSDALPVGTESEIEYFDMELAEPLPESSQVLESLNRGLPPGMEVKDVIPAPARRPGSAAVSYLITLRRPLRDEQLQNIERFIRSESCIMVRKRKNRVREIDIRPLVRSMEADADTIRLTVISMPGQAGAAPRDILRLAAGLAEEEILLARILKTGVADFSASA